VKTKHSHENVSVVSYIRPVILPHLNINKRPTFPTINYKIIGKEKKDISM